MLKRVVSLFIIFVLIMLFVQSPVLGVYGSTIIYDTKSEGFTKSGQWYSSGILGYENSATIFSAQKDSTAVWQPNLFYSGKYRIYIYNIVKSDSAETVQVEVSDKFGNKTQKQYSNKNGVEGFVDLGEYEFSYGFSGYVKVTALSNSYVRLNCVKFELVEKGEGIPNLVPATGEETYEDYATRPLQNREVNLPETKENAFKIYVEKGRINGDGSEGNPFGTIEEAQEKVRQIKSAGYPQDGIGVYVKGGTYFLDTTLTLTGEDSGTAQSPVIWQPYDGQKVSLTTGKRLDKSIFNLVTDQKILNRVPQQGRGNIYVADLNMAGISGLSELNLKSENPYVLTFDDKSGSLSKWPNEGYDISGELVETSSRSNSGPRKKGFTYDINNSRVLRWISSNNSWLNGYWMTPYTIDYTKVAQIDKDSMQIAGKHYNDLGSYGKARYYVQNLLEEIDSMGEWYVDPDENKLYVYPFDGWQNQEILFGVKSDNIVNFSSSENVILRDFTYKVSRGNGVVLSEGSSYCGVIGGEIINVGGIGGAIRGKNNYIRDCDISYTGGPGISIIGGVPEKMIFGNNYAENNKIHDVGTGGGQKQGVSYGGCGNRISNNHVYNILTQGMSGSGMAIIIEYNIVERTNLEMGDTGGIYFINPGMGYGTKIRYNLVRDTVGVLQNESAIYAGACGIYLDNGSSGIDVYGNIVYNVPDKGLYSNAGREIKFYNNIVINAGNAAYIPKSAGTNADLGNKSNIVKYPYKESPLIDWYPTLGTIDQEFDDNSYALPKYDVVQKNVAYKSGDYSVNAVTNCGGTVSQNLSFDYIPTTDLNTFFDFDYTQIKAQIPDFEEIPVEQMGIYNGGARTDSQTVVYDNRANPFNTIYPLNGENNVDIDCEMKWSVGFGGVVSSSVYIASDEGFENIEDYGISDNGSYKPKLDYGTTYYWRVKSLPAQGYDERWNADGVRSFTTISADDKLAGEIFATKSMLNVWDEGTEEGKVPFGSKENLHNILSNAQSVLEGEDIQLKKTVIKELISARESFVEGANPNTTNLSTLVYDDYTTDTIGQRPLGLFLRSYSPLDGYVQPDPLNSNNKAVRFMDEHPQYHYGQRYFRSQCKFLEAGTKVLPMQTNGAFSVTLMETGKYAVEAGVTSSCVAKVVFATDGNIYGDGNKQFLLMSYESLKWYDVKIVLRLFSDDYDVYINGIKKAEKIPLYNKNVNEINQIVYDTSDGTAETKVTIGTFYIDNTIIRAPKNDGRNPYLLDLKINGKEISGFEPGKSMYNSGLTSGELSVAKFDYISGDNAKVNIYNYKNNMYITAISADKQKVFYYIVK